MALICRVAEVKPPGPIQAQVPLMGCGPRFTAAVVAVTVATLVFCQAAPFTWRKGTIAVGVQVPVDIFTVMVVVSVSEPDFPVTVMVAVPVAVALAAIVTVSPLTVAVTPVFELAAVRVTAPVKLPVSATVMASFTLLPGASVSEGEAGGSVKPPPPLTVTAMVIGGSVSEPDFPVTVMVAVPVAVALAVIVTVSPLTVAVTPVFELAAVTVTAPVKLPVSVTRSEER